MNPKGIVTKTVGVTSAACLCLAVLTTPVGASVLLRGGMAGSGVTEPGALTVLGVILLSMGLWTRRVVLPRRVLPKAS